MLTHGFHCAVNDPDKSLEGKSEGLRERTTSRHANLGVQLILQRPELAILSVQICATCAKGIKLLTVLGFQLCTLSAQSKEVISMQTAGLLGQCNMSIIEQIVA